MMMSRISKPGHEYKVAAQMNTFEYYYAVSLAEMVLHIPIILGRCCKRIIYPAAQGQEGARLVKKI